MSDELKPCPFCGTLPLLAYRGQPAGACFVGCSRCQARGPESTAGMTGSGGICDVEVFWSTAIKQWNTRATDERLAEAERLLREVSGTWDTIDRDEITLMNQIDAFLAKGE